MLVHITLLFAFVSWTGAAGSAGSRSPTAPCCSLGLAVVLGLTGIALLFRKVRNLVLEPVLRGARAAVGEIAGVFRSPLRVGELLGGAAGHDAVVHPGAGRRDRRRSAAGSAVPQIGAAYLGASLVGNAAPTPGGLGAVEAALVAALTGFGLESGPAVSAVLTYRLATYWLPTLPGWFVFRWMQAA